MLMDNVSSAGQTGPVSPFMGDPDAPERKDAESLGLGLFNESLEGWADLYAINTFSVFFVTSAFLGLLAKGSEDVKDYWSSVINITSISGHIKVAQNHASYFVHKETRRSLCYGSFVTTVPKPQLRICQSC